MAIEERLKDTASASGATEALARFAVETETSSLPPDVMHAAMRAVLDTIGVTLAGSTETVSKIVSDQVRAQGNRAECTIWGTGFSVSAQDAAFVNGTASHALDFDDTHAAMHGHPSVSVLPAVVAFGERVKASGADVLAAFAIGLEVECKLGLLTGHKPYDLGWHLTATHGVVGATAGVGRLAGLSVDEMRHAIGIAVSQASGVRQNFGTMTKPLHVGRAAQSAILSVELAQRGLTASSIAIEGDVGYLAVFGRDPDHTFESLKATLGNPYALVDPGVNVKSYPCCAFTHGAIDIARDMSEGLSEDTIDRVVVGVPYTAPLVLIHHRPKDPLSAKFSLEYCVATALLDQKVTLTHFTDDVVQRDDVQSLLRRVEYVVPEKWQAHHGPMKTGMAQMDVYLRDGSVRHAETDTVRGSAGLPLSDAELDAKFLSCAELTVGRGRAEEALRLIHGLQQLDSITELTRRLGAS